MFCLPHIHDIVTSVLNNFPEVFKIMFGQNYDTSWMIVPFSGDCEVGTDYLHVKKIPGETEKIDWDNRMLRTTLFGSRNTTGRGIGALFFVSGCGSGK